MFAHKPAPSWLTFTLSHSWVTSTSSHCIHDLCTNVLNVLVCPECVQFIKSKARCLGSSRVSSRVTSGSTRTRSRAANCHIVTWVEIATCGESVISRDEHSSCIGWWCGTICWWCGNICRWCYGDNWLGSINLLALSSTVLSDFFVNLLGNPLYNLFKAYRNIRSCCWWLGHISRSSGVCGCSCVCLSSIWHSLCARVSSIRSWDYSSCSSSGLTASLALAIGVNQWD